MSDVQITIHGTSGELVKCEVPVGFIESIVTAASAEAGTVVIDGGHGICFRIPGREIAQISIELKR